MVMNKLAEVCFTIFGIFLFLQAFESAYIELRSEGVEFTLSEDTSGPPFYAQANSAACIRCNPCVGLPEVVPSRYSWPARDTDDYFISVNASLPQDEVYTQKQRDTCPSIVC